MALTPTARKRLAMAFVAVGIGLIVERTIASAGDAEAATGPATDPASASVGASSPRSSSPSLANPASASPELRLDRLAGRADATEPESPAGAIALFAVHSWQPPGPPPPPPRHVEPGVPPFPYAYLGGLTDDAGRTAFFGRSDRVLPVRGGDTVDGAYRVDHLDETLMTLTYLPLQKTLSVRLGGGQ